MIVLYMEGRLGNQLFNYAAARTLADRHRVDLVIDASLYRDQWQPGAERPLLIHEFPLRAKFRNFGPELDNHNPFQRVLRRVREDLCVEEVKRFRTGENGTQCWQYDQNFEHLGSRTIMRGFYINMNYFRGADHEVRKDLQLGSEFCLNDNELNLLFDKISDSHLSVAIHVRRGDHLDHLLPDWSRFRLNGIENYYLNAMRYFSDRFEDPVFWIFSDDHSWCRNLFSDHHYDLRFVDNIPASNSRPLKEFYLMKSCDHQIISNSTFSWWAAWLNGNGQKIVLSPFVWDRDGLIPIREIVPKEWVLIKW